MTALMEGKPTCSVAVEIAALLLAGFVELRSATADGDDPDRETPTAEGGANAQVGNPVYCKRGCLACQAPAP